MSTVIIVGAGVIGSSLARYMATNGWDVVLVDQSQPGHVASGSGGVSRLLRSASGEDLLQQTLARRARELWREVEDESGHELLLETGVVWLAHRADGWELASERSLTSAGIPIERVDPCDFFPAIHVDDLAFALFEPEAGILRAATATKQLARLAQKQGTRIVRGRAHPAGTGVWVDQRRLDADLVVWACGAWLPKLFPEYVHAVVTRQDVLFLASPSKAWSAEAVPPWVDIDRAFYGTGDLDGFGIKVAPDRPGPQFDPDGERAGPLPTAVDAVRHYVSGRFRDLADAPLVHTRVCQYATTPDSRYIVAPHPEHDSVWLIGGDCGHAFKHGPAFAEWLVPQLEGEVPPDPRLSLSERYPATSSSPSNTPWT
jgi:sarcosine oxidase